MMKKNSTCKNFHFNKKKSSLEYLMKTNLVSGQKNSIERILVYFSDFKERTSANTGVVDPFQ